MDHDTPLIYLAGPTVFAPDAEARFDALRRVCEAAGARALCPVDGELPEGLAGPALARRIFDANIALLRRAHAVIADARPFRGLEPDSGTMFEIGFAHALGLPVAVYGVPAGLHEARIAAAWGAREHDGRRVDAREGWLIESFGLPLNLMIACPATVAPDAAAAVRAVLARLHKI